MEKYFSNVDVKEEGADGGWPEELRRVEQARSHVRDSAVRMAANAGMAAGAISKSRAEPRDRNNDRGGARYTASPLKTPKYGGTSDWEAFHAQFELLAHAGEWTEEEKALQLAMCLTDDALKCLLLISPEDRHDYGALVGALKRRFGQCVRPDLLKNELSSRCRLPGEPLRVLANDIESLTRRAYAHMPPDVQSELARDQFIRALSPTELRVHVQLEHPQSVQAALELAVEREIVWGVSAGSSRSEGMPTTRVARRPGEASVGVGDNRTDTGYDSPNNPYPTHITQAVLGVWPTRTPPQAVPKSFHGPGKRPRVCIGGTVQTPASAPSSSSTGGAQQHRRGSQAPLSPEADNNISPELVVVVGRTCVGDFCHVPVTVEGVPCSALVDTGSTVTLIRPDVVPGWTQLEPTTVQLRTVTGRLAPMRGKGMMTLTVGGRAVRHPVWVAGVQDLCILGLDFLKATGCQLDLGGGTLRFQDGPAIMLAATMPLSTAPAALPAREVVTAEHQVKFLSKEQTEKLIKIRCQNDLLFTGAKHSATVGWRIILEKMGLGGKVQPHQAKKKDCKYPGTGEGTSGKPTAANWPWFVLMDEALGQRPSIAPPVLIASIPEDTPGPSAEEEEEELEELEESQTGPKRKRRRREDDLLSLMREDMKMQREVNK
ncbi:hypothetical protein N1851_022974 [Merluccius polli]|uniref:Peptidase A2 domain-containing protein n=1 Tax=Merluccius polli TaxID=89951 RepID=A0AA47NX24_MERPO|nr:hypothetical protein N1851_022974 [Merluccius polli]